MTTTLQKLFALATASLAVTAVAVAGKVEVDAKMPEYKTVAGVSGNLNSIGSDTLNNLMTFWAEGFKAKYPNVKIQIEGKGSATAPPALIEGTAQIGPMSRPMKREEISAFEKKYGYKPTEIKVAIDALAVFVHKDNALKGLTMKQVDGIFSSTRKSGSPSIDKWGQLGLTGDLAGKPISLYGRNSASGTYGFFKEHTLKKGDFRDTVKEQPGSSTVVQGVANDVTAIGYSGIGYITPGVKAVALGTKEGKYVEATYENCLSGDYPLSRYLYIYLNRAPGKRCDPVVEEFVKFIASQEGQQIVVKDGYFPLTAELANESRTNLVYSFE
jgi:phosphate transport system substrate-binding protein